jgi:hypothetical protein
MYDHEIHTAHFLILRLLEEWLRVVKTGSVGPTSTFQQNSACNDLIGRLKEAQSVEVVASTLYEAATLAMAAFRRCGFTENAPGVATRLIVVIKQPSTKHAVQWGKVEARLQSASKPNEQAMKTRLRELLSA